MRLLGYATGYRNVPSPRRRWPVSPVNELRKREAASFDGWQRPDCLTFRSPHTNPVVVCLNTGNHGENNEKAVADAGPLGIELQDVGSCQALPSMFRSLILVALLCCTAVANANAQ